MEFKRENPDCKFVIPDTITVRQQLAYMSQAAIASGDQMFERYWKGAVPLIVEWNCESMPDHETSLDKISNTDATQVIIWAGLQVKKYIDGLGKASKN